MHNQHSGVLVSVLCCWYEAWDGMEVKETNRKIDRTAGQGSTVMQGDFTLPFVETEARQERSGCQSKSRAPSLGPAGNNSQWLL